MHTKASPLESPGWALVHKTTYAPMIYTSLCVIFMMRADTLRKQVGGGWALEMESFLGPVKWHRADRRVPLGAQKTPPNYKNIKNITHGAV